MTRNYSQQKKLQRRSWRTRQTQLTVGAANKILHELLSEQSQLFLYSAWSYSKSRMNIRIIRALSRVNDSSVTPVHDDLAFRTQAQFKELSNFTMLISTVKLRGKCEICVGRSNDSPEIGRENKRPAEEKEGNIRISLIRGHLDRQIDIIKSTFIINFVTKWIAKIMNDKKDIPW